MEMLKNIPLPAVNVFCSERIHDTGTMHDPQLREAQTFKENRRIVPKRQTTRSSLR
jgi:hypothetical protein